MQVEVIGYIASFLIVTCYIPQIVKIYKNKNADGVSVYMYSILFTGQVLYVIYGILKNDIPIIFVNTVGSLLNLIIIGMTLYFTR